MSLLPIGILGGMGPEATVLLQQRIIDRTVVGDDADHIPLLIDMNPQVPSRIAHLIEQRGADPTPTLQRMAQGLEHQGARALAMPCNTAHHYAEAIQAKVQIPLLNMVRLSAGQLAQREYGTRVGLLASPAVRRTGVFDQPLASTGRRAVYLPHDKTLLELIQRIKRHGTDETAVQSFTALAEALAQESDILLIACSELSLLRDTLPDTLSVLDTVDVLADACIQFSHSTQL